MGNSSHLDHLLAEARRAGLTIAVSPTGYAVVSGPAGTEQLALDVAKALDAERLGPHADDGSIDEPYVFGRPRPTLRRPGPFNPTQYAELLKLRQRHLRGDYW